MADKIILQSMEFFSHIGVFDFEKEQGQNFRLDLELSLGYLTASDKDDLSLTINYAEVYDRLQAFFAAAKHDLLEKAAGDIINLLFSHYPQVNQVKLRLMKPDAPIEGRFAYMAVELNRKRQELVYLGLGSNLGDSKAILDQACQALVELPGVSHFRLSSLRRTKAWGKEDQPDFINAAAEFQYTGSPFRLLTDCLAIEEKLGRVRREKWGPRTIDLDIIFFGDLTVNSPDLQIPHPYFRERDFVLEPLRELGCPFID